MSEPTKNPNPSQPTAPKPSVPAPSKPSWPPGGYKKEAAGDKGTRRLTKDGGKRRGI